MWIADALPAVTTPAPSDYSSQSAPCLIQTRRGEHYTARWTAYADPEFGSFWDLCGREGLQLAPADVVAWQAIVPFVAEA